jgi:Fe-S-cluster containining protein
MKLTTYEEDQNDNISCECIFHNDGELLIPDNHGKCVFLKKTKDNVCVEEIHKVTCIDCYFRFHDSGEEEHITMEDAFGVVPCQIKPAK